jgi:hypothetical protein
MRYDAVRGAPLDADGPEGARRMMITEPRTSRWFVENTVFVEQRRKRQDDVGAGRTEIECLAGTGEVYFWERGFVRWELELELGLDGGGPKLGVRCLRPEQ